MADSLETRFEQLHGRQATVADKQRLAALARDSGIEQNDAIWSILLLLDKYHQKYEALQAGLGDESGKVLKEFRSTAKVEAKAAQADTMRDLTAAVQASAQKVARQVAGKQLAQSIIAAVLAVGVVQAGLFGAVWEQAKEYGYQQTRNETATMAWGNLDHVKRWKPFIDMNANLARISHQSYHTAANKLFLVDSLTVWDRQGR